MSDEKRTHILLVDEDATTAGLVQAALGSDEFQITTVRTGEEAYAKALKQRPDLVITEAVLPGIDGYNLTRNWRQNPATASLAILMLSTKSEVSDKVAGFEAGVDDYVTKPFQPPELAYRIKNLVARARVTAQIAVPTRKHGRIITIFGTKGGVGKTTLAVNLAIGLQRKTRSNRIVLVDADFFFGDVPLHMNLAPTSTMLDLVNRMDQLDAELMEKVLLVHSSGVRVLMAPAQPEQAEQVTAMHMERILECLVEMFDFVIVDCHPDYDDRNLLILEQSDVVLFVVRPELGPLKNMGVFLNLALKLGLDLNKIHIVLNRAGSKSGIEIEQIERSFKSRVAFRMMSGGRTVVQSVNRGVPLMIEKPNHPFSKQILSVADFVIRQSPNGRVAVKK